MSSLIFSNAVLFFSNPANEYLFGKYEREVASEEQREVHACARYAAQLEARTAGCTARQRIYFFEWISVPLDPKTKYACIHGNYSSGEQMIV